MSILLGMDLGNDHTKVVADLRDGRKNRIVVPTVVLPVPDDYTRERSDLARRTLLDTLDVTIDSRALEGTSRRWLVGEILTRETDLAKLAQRASEREQKHTNTKLYATGLAALAALAVQRLGAKEDTLHVQTLTVSLPVAGYTQEARKEVIRRLKGTHIVRFNGVEGVRDGRQVTLTIERVRVIPEGMGAALAQIYTVRDGRAVPVREDLLKKTFGVADIGGRTSDFVFFGPELDYQDSLSGGAPYGIADALTAILRDARKAAGDDTVLRNEAELVNVIKRGEWRIPLRRDELDLRPIMERHLRPLADKVAADIQARWETRVRELFLVGGGAAVLRPYLKLPAEYMPTVVEQDPQLANALGNFIFSVLNAEAVA